MTKTIAAARQEAVRLTKRYLGAPEEERTALLRGIAEAFVDARALFERPDGSPDWKGRTYLYRMWVREVFSEAGVAPDKQATIQSAVRYHIGAVLRDRLDDETLADYDLIPQSPKERSKGRRQQRTAVVQAITARDISGGSLMAITASHAVLAKLAPRDTDELEGPSKQVAEQTLADLERRVKAIRRRLASRA